MTRGLDDFQAELQSQLVTAGYRQRQARLSQAKGTRLGPVGLRVLAGLVMLVAVVGVGLTVLSPANKVAADVFVIRPLGESVEIDVVELVDNPQEVVAQLRDELGLTAYVQAVPVSPPLVGRIVAFGSVGGDLIEVVLSEDAGVQTIILQEGFAGDLRIEYGRRGASGEAYLASGSGLYCSAVYGLTPEKSLPKLEALGLMLRFETIDAEFRGQTNVAVQDIPADWVVAETIELSDVSAIVTFAPNLEILPRAKDCM